jgi:hypothetical protein
VNRCVARLSLALFSLAAFVPAACAPNAPRLRLPIRTDASCENRADTQPALDSIVASTDDTVRPGTYPGDASLRKVIKSVGGVFAYWNDQAFSSPGTAKALGVSGDLTLKRAVITNQFDRTNTPATRPVWLTFATPKGDVTVLERAYDVQDVCIEGTRDV